MHAPGNDRSPVFSVQLESSRLFGVTEMRGFVYDFVSAHFYQLSSQKIAVMLTCVCSGTRYDGELLPVHCLEPT